MIKNILLSITISTSLLAYQSGLEIMKKVQARDDGDNIIANMQMQLIDKNGNKRIRDMKIFSKYIGEDEKKLIFFLSPSDVKNTAFLTFDYKDDAKDDDQWLYLPALNKTKRIPASDKDSSFMGSDFSYSDMTEPVLSDYTFKILKESIVKRKSGNLKVWQIEVTPKNQTVIDETGYLKSVAYVRQDNYMVTRAKYYLKRAGRMKYMDVKKVETIDGIDVATQTIMITKKGKRTLHKTILIQSDIKMNQNLKEDLFTTRTIENGL
ncbi:Outer membrane lipoprotein-sorting protein [hydrothermal vent metagenome]|uniref:Outer membrane lipoprotein-sorting protein n=1 Tax=hydrothermal vent metagenome TaxID=652676 RepID=A0A3B1DVX8_9ZZZZ